jgi:alpha-mannosidase
VGTKAQWKIKSQFALDADKQSKDLQSLVLKAVASLVKTDAPSLIFLNPTSWPRPGYRAGAERLEPIEVPSCGYRVVSVKDMVQPMVEPADGAAIESRFYRVSFDQATGAITSIFDKELKRELVDPKAPYRLDQYLYVSGGEGTRIVENGPEAKLAISTPEKAVLRRAKVTNYSEAMTVETSATMTPKIVTEVTVWNDVKRVDIVNRVTKTQTYKKEAVYFAFPFAAEKPTFRYEVPCGIVNANKDMLPGACLDWFTVQHFVEVEAPDVAIAWATPDAPLVCFQDINRGKWQTKLPFTNGHLYAYVMNNYWFTNYLAGQGGDFTFRFAITSRPKSDPVASAQFGWGVSNPLVAAPVEANPNGLLAAPSGSLIEIAEPNVLLIGAKKAEASDALVLRLWELTGQATTAHVRIPLLKPKKATACNLVEEPQGDLELKDGTIAVPIKASGLATVMIE